MQAFKVLFILLPVTLKGQDYLLSCFFHWAFFFPHRYKAKCVSAYVIMGWCSLQNLEREQKNRVAEWPFKVGIMATRGPLAKTARTRQPGGTAVKG